MPSSKNLYHIETSHSICKANQLTGFHMIRIFVKELFLNRLLISVCKTRSIGPSITHHPITELKCPLSFFALSRGPWRIIAQFCGLLTNQKWKISWKESFYTWLFFWQLRSKQSRRGVPLKWTFFSFFFLSFCFFFFFFVFLFYTYKTVGLYKQQRAFGINHTLKDLKLIIAVHS